MSDQTFTIRPYRVPEDDTGTAALSAACSDNPWTVADIQEWRRTFPTAGIECDFVATDEAGTIVGHANAYRYPWAPPGRFSVGVTVHPEARGQGLGKTLFALIREFAVRHGASSLHSVVAEDDPPAVHFATSLSLEIERHEFESRIDVTTWHEDALADKLATIEALGIRFFTYADEPCEPALYELAKRNAVDLPGYDPSADYPSIDEWRKRWLEDPDSPLDCIILAAVNETLVGVIRMGMYNESGDMKTWHTSVAREHRGKGIAVALKILALHTAKRYGARALLTDNDSTNTAILRVNEKLGFQPLPGVFHVRCTV